MMTRQQAEYELRHFRNAPREENDARMNWVLRKWEFRGDPRLKVLEIGTGPYGGCLGFIEAGLKIALDPLLDEYHAEGLLADWSPNWHGMTNYVEDLAAMPWLKVDAVLCFNVLEHGTSSFDSIDHIAPLLKPGGRFYLEQSLRDETQLNEAHTHVMRVEDLEAAIARNGLRTVRQWIEPPQVFGSAKFDYPAVLGIYEAPAA